MLKFSDRWAIVATIDPVSQGTVEALSDEIDMSKFHQLSAVLLLGALGSSGTVDGGFQASATSGGSYAAVSATTITQLTQAGTDDNKQVVVNLKADETAGKRYVKFGVTPGAAASLVGAVVFGLPRYGLPTDQDLATVDEVVN